MTTFANAIALLCFLAACFRARWVALALAPAVALILASWTGLVDLSSASHPARWLVPLVGALGATIAMGLSVRDLRELTVDKLFAEEHSLSLRWPRAIERARRRRYRTIFAALLVFSSDVVDLVALHPAIWRIPGVWVITPIQFVVCVSILGILVVPERWIIKCIK